MGACARAVTCAHLVAGLDEMGTATRGGWLVVHHSVVAILIAGQCKSGFARAASPGRHVSRNAGNIALQIVVSVSSPDVLTITLRPQLTKTISLAMWTMHDTFFMGGWV